MIQAARTAEQPSSMVDLTDICNEMHVMAAIMRPKPCDLAARLQSKVHYLIDDHRRAHPEGRP